jgi:hypothetical protein
MESALALALWIADASVPGARPERRSALRSGWELAQVAAAESAIEGGPQGYGRFARFLAELTEDGWLRFDYQRWPGDDKPPIAAFFDENHLQRADNIRLTPEGWRAISAVRVRPVIAPSAQGDDEQRHFFISHASEDKGTVAKPLADELLRRGWRVWFDKFELTVGDSLRRSIDHGLTLSRFGVVILSPSFFAKEWPQRELDGLTAREAQSGAKVILPIWHQIDTETVIRYSPSLGDKLGLPSEMGAEGLADELERVLLAGGEAIGGAPPRSTAEPAERPRPSISAGEDSVLDALLDQNPVAVREVLRRTRGRFTGPIDEAVRGRSSEPMTEEVLSELDKVLRPQIAGYAAQLLPLVEHAPDELGEQLERLADWASREPASGYANWNEVPRWACWCLGQILGTCAVRAQAFTAAGALLRTQMTTRFSSIEPLIDGVPGSFGCALAEQVVEPPEGRKWAAPEWEYVREIIESSEPMAQATAELFTKEGDPKRAMGDWSLIHCLGLGLRQIRSAAYFSVSTGGARELALRLHRDAAMRTRLATAAYGIELAHLDEQAAEALGFTRGMGHFHDTEAIQIFLTGSI